MNENLLHAQNEMCWSAHERMLSDECTQCILTHKKSQSRTSKRSGQWSNKTSRHMPG